MLEIEKFVNGHGYDCFTIKTDDGEFVISFQGNLDLYWNYSCRRSEFNTIDKKEIVITKENYFLYSLFDDLYKNVLCGITIERDYNTFLNEILNDGFYDSLYPYNLFENGIVDWNNYDVNSKSKDDDIIYVADDEYNKYRLLNNGVIDWHSDDFPYDVASRLLIKKESDCYRIVFIKSMEDNIYKTFAIRFRNSGSSYETFNTLFMIMYNKLKDYDPDFHQIHIEEYLYKTRKLSKK